MHQSAQEIFLLFDHESNHKKIMNEENQGKKFVLQQNLIKESGRKEKKFNLSSLRENIPCAIGTSYKYFYVYLMNFHAVVGEEIEERKS